MKYAARTDLALESRNAYEGDLEGASLREFTLHGCKVTELAITDHSASDALCKPKGTYYTLQLQDYVSRRQEAFSSAVLAMAELLRRLVGIEKADSALVACLGNRNITPDAIGSLCADSLIVSRHLKSAMPDSYEFLSDVSVLRTGVLGTTGIETADIVRSVCRSVRPDCVLVVDALASSDISRLCRTVQLCDSGIAPGSGVGNNRERLDRESLGVPVIAVGVPTVTDAAEGFFVTPRNIDQLAASVSKLIAYGIDLALHPGLTIEDVDLLVE